MSVLPTSIALAIVALLAALPLPARADDRSALDACQALVDRAAKAPPDASGTSPDDAQLQRCKIIVREWALRDSRMIVDEHGRPQR